MKERLGPADLAPGGMRGYELPGGRYVLVSNVGGRFFAIDDMCNHAGCLLSGGVVKAEAVVCPCHEMTFDLRDGRLLSTPRLCDDQRVYDVVVQGGQLYLEGPDGSR